MTLLLSHGLVHEFGKLTRVDLCRFLCFFSFNVELIENYDSCFILIYFLWGYHDLVTWIVNLTSYLKLTNVNLTCRGLNIFCLKNIILIFLLIKI